MDQPHIAVILGTARKGRESEKVAGFVLERARQVDSAAEIIDARDYRLPATDNTEESDTAKRYEEKILGADALIIVTPEYNHGYPGELKMMLDMIYRQYAGKACGLVGVSAGGYGGVRGLANLLPVLHCFGLKIAKRTVSFSRVQDLFDDENRLKEAEPFEKQVDSLVKEVLALA